jgi:hypothetical protein
MDRYAEVWNGAALQEIRRELAAGRFASYCIDSTACPLVRKLGAAHVLPAHQRRRLAFKHAWTRFDVRLHGVPVRVWQVVYRLWHAGVVLVTDPARAYQRARQVLGHGPGPAA